MNSRLFSYPERNDKEKITAEGFKSSAEATLRSLLFLITTAFTAELKPTFTLSPLKGAALTSVKSVQFPTAEPQPALLGLK